MQIQVNTDSSIKGDERLEEVVEGMVADRLERFRQEITRVEVHIRDENADKGGPDDTRCMIEARLKGMKPQSVTHHASNVEDSVSGAVGKIWRALDSTLGKRNRHR